MPSSHQATLIWKSIQLRITEPGEVALGLGAGVAPAQVSGDRVALIGVGPVVGAVEREVAQCGELGFEKFSQLNVVGGGPAGNLGCLCGEELSRIMWSFCPGQRRGSSSKMARNSRQRSRPDPVEDLACGQVRVQCGDHVPHPAGATVAGPWPHRVPGGPPGAGGAAAAGSRAGLVRGSPSCPKAGGQQVKHTAHLHTKQLDSIPKIPRGKITYL